MFHVCNRWTRDLLWWSLRLQVRKACVVRAAAVIEEKSVGTAWQFTQPAGKDYRQANLIKASVSVLFI